MVRLLGVLLLLSGLVLGGVWHTYQRFLEAPLDVPEQGLIFSVAKGATLRQVARQLEQQGVLKQPDYLFWHARWTQQAHRIRAGEFALLPGTRPDGLLALLISGPTVQHTLTLLEGWNFRQVMQAVRDNPILQQQLVDQDDQQIMQTLGFAGVHPEGRFFPDTYAFPRGTTDIEFLRRAYLKMEQQLTEAWQSRNRDTTVIDSPEQALILASIIEKETGLASERPAIAGVFSRRLRLGMKLQTDPTVIYGMGERYQGNIRRADLREDTPYNTYVHKGLPPTPICMPGREALDAALNPADGQALYFVARGDGSHQFSATLKQHNAAVRKYQLKK